MAKVFLDPGHGGRDPGAVGHGLREKDVVLKIARYARDYLLSNYSDVEVRMSRTGDTYPSLSGRANNANRWGADVFVSIHINAASASANGYEDFIYNGPVSNNTHRLQDAVHKKLAPLFPTNRGQKRANFAVLRLTKMSAVLTECGFITNKRDADYLKKNSNLKKLGEAHAIGIANHLKLSKRKSGTSQQKGVNTLSSKEYTELKRKMDSLEQSLNNKIDKRSTSNTPHPSHKDQVEQAKALGISTGQTPRQYATREQVMTMVVNTYNKIYPDIDKAGPSHEEAVRWGMENDITDGSNPHHPATRQQVVTMIKRSVDYVMAQLEEVNEPHPDSENPSKED